jgi:hypothetical protein
MSDFSRWSRWFECGLDLPREKAPTIAMMGWIAAHASSDGTGLEFDSVAWKSLADEIGLTVDEAKSAVETLIGAGLLAAVGQQTNERLAARAVI